MVEYLNDSKIKQYAEVFSNHDFYSEGYISARSVFEILISMNLQITYQDIQQLIKETGNTSPKCDRVELSQFLAIISM